MVCGFWFVEALSPGLHEGRGFGIFWGNADGCAFFFVHGGGRGSVLSRVRVMGYTTPCTMHKRTPLIVAIGTITFLASCNKGSGEGPEGMSPVRDFIASTRSAGEQSFVLDASAGGMITGARGTIIVVAPQAFRRHDGGVVTGPVTVRLLEAYEVGDMVALNMQTVARNGAGKMALQSGGEVRLRAESAGQQVTVAPGLAMVHFPADQPNPDMLAWVGEEDADGDILWDEPNALALDSGIAVPDTVGGQGWINGYFYSEPWPAGSFGGGTWPPFDMMNCDHPLPPGGDSTDVAVLLPQEELGAMVWLVFPSINCMVYMEGYHAGGVSADFPVRIGLQGTIVALRIDGSGGFHASFTPIIVMDGHEQAITLGAMSEAAYMTGLQGL